MQCSLALFSLTVLRYPGIHALQRLEVTDSDLHLARLDPILVQQRGEGKGSCKRWFTTRGLCHEGLFGGLKDSVPRSYDCPISVIEELLLKLGRPLGIKTRQGIR